MKALTGLGKYFLCVTALVFGINHFLNATYMAGLVPIPGGVIWVYVSGAALILAALAIAIGKKDGLASFLLGVLLLIIAFSVHLPTWLGNNDAGAMANFLKDFGLAGGAWIYCNHAAKEPM